MTADSLAEGRRNSAGLLERYQVATLLLNFDRDIGRAGLFNIGWGLLVVTIGLFALEATPWGWVNVGLGILLIGEGLYCLRVRSAFTLLTLAATLGIIAAWNLGAFAVGWLAGYSLGGHVVWGAVQAVAAYNTYRVRGFYQQLHQDADPGAVEYVKSLIADLKRSNPQLAPDTVQFDVRKKTEAPESWRCRFFGEGVLFHYSPRKVFGIPINGTDQAFWAERRDLHIERRGETWTGGKMKARLQTGGEPIDIQISAEMLQKLETLRG